MMTKSKFIDDVAIRVNMTRAGATRVCEQVFDALIDAVLDRDGMCWPGFGTFTRVERAARKGRNPQTGETIDIPAKDALVFIASKALKERMQ